MRRSTERWYPRVIGLFVFACTAAWQFKWLPSMPPGMRDLLPAIINISAIAIGFTATAKSILFTIEDRPIIQQLKKMGLFSPFVGYIFATIAWFFFLALATASLMLIDSWSWWLPRLIVAAWFGLLAAAIAAYYRIAHILAKLLKHGADGLAPNAPLS